MSYVLILNRKHFPVSFIGRRIAFSALSCCKSNIYFYAFYPVHMLLLVLALNFVNR